MNEPGNEALPGGEDVPALLFVGLPACAAVVVGFPVLGAFALRGPPLEFRDWVGGVVCWVLAFVGALVAARAGWWRGGASRVPMMARLSPLLLLAGVLFGLWAGFQIAREHLEHYESWALSHWCDEPSLVGQPDAASCEPRALACLHQAWRGEVVDDAEVAERLRATLQARRAALVLEAEARARDGWLYSQPGADQVDRVLATLRVDPSRPNASTAERAALVCLAAGLR